MTFKAFQPDATLAPAELRPGTDPDSPTQR